MVVIASVRKSQSWTPNQSFESDRQQRQALGRQRRHWSQEKQEGRLLAEGDLVADVVPLGLWDWHNELQIVSLSEQEREGSREVVTGVSR